MSIIHLCLIVEYKMEKKNTMLTLRIVFLSKFMSLVLNLFLMKMT